MKRLIPRQRAKHYSWYGFENPFFAVAEVDSALSRPYDLPGLHDLIHECGSSSGECRREYPRRAILKKVRDGDWLLACSRPFSPFTPEAALWPVLPARGDGRIEGEVKSESSQVDVFVLQQVVGAGPGKWVLKDIDHDALRNAFTILANRSGTIANEGSVIFSEGKDWANTSRTLTHEWVRLSVDEKHFESGSAIHRYGDSKKTVQKYVESADHWAVTGQSWHWIPATPNVIFERRK
ncbi:MULTISPECIES: hypothetical protein [Pseudomonas]|uniref:hypothetical protein n=1 Tax=Pseudomonas TaxID=286 RepID=UPI00224B2CFF|nr:MULTISPECIES: hypothetical protein [unclassified Pseudomonas]MCX2890814.1 hypothetical protein [Pseudomonas sp. DCB_BI]MDH4549773.1 hypothetical protein [Pseudomonas sp. BN607]